LNEENLRMNDIAVTDAASSPAAARYTLWQLVGYMLGLGTWGFGGPVALVGYNWPPVMAS